MNKKGFTLIEVLAVVVILSIILVIAIPQITILLKDSRLKALKDSALLIAKNAEREYMVQKTTNKDFDPSSFSCEKVGKITRDYGSCSIAFDENGKASVTLIGIDTGKFKDMKCEGTLENMNCVIDESEGILLTFNANGGNVNTSTKKIKAGNVYGGLPTPTKEGYVFKGWSLLPDEYQAVDYIVSDGTQYINVNYDIKPEEKFEGKIYTTVENTEMALIGPVQGYGTLEIGYNRYGRFMSWSSNSDVIVVTPTTSFYGKDVTFIATISATSPNRTLNVNGITSSGGTGAPNSGRIRLFNMQSNYPFIGRIYYMKIYDHDTIVRDLIPCYRINDRVVGLYDTINGVFYPNSNTSGNNFDIGNEINLPIVTSNTIIALNEDHTVNAIWGKEVTVTFDANGGTVNTSSKKVLVGDTYGDLPTPTRTGYTFKGWNGKNKFDKSQYLKLEDYNEGSVYKMALINLENGKSYTAHIEKINEFNDKITTYLLMYNRTASSNWLALAHGSAGTSKSALTYSIDSSNKLYIGYVNSSSYHITTQEELDLIWANVNVQIEEGTEATPYEPYYITSNTKVVQNQDHTLTAVWEKNSFVSDIKSLVTATASNTDWKIQTDTHNVYSNGVATSTTYTDYRYTGQNPNNYIDIGDTGLWRVMGVINEEYDSDGDGTVDTRGELIKIVKDGFLTTAAWTSGSYTGNSNNWSTSKLMKALNEIGESSFYSYRIPNDIKPYMVKVRWHLLGNNDIITTSSVNGGSSDNIYNAERYTGSTYNGNPAYLDANVGFIYPSDVMYSLFNSTSRQMNTSCTTIESESYLYDYVAGNNSANYYWLMTPSNVDSTIYRLTSAACILKAASYEYTGTSIAFVKPTIYLKGDIKVNGSGTSTDPYTIISE